jgi:hypothetical protein
MCAVLQLPVFHCNCVVLQFVMSVMCSGLSHSSFLGAVVYRSNCVVQSVTSVMLLCAVVYVSPVHWLQWSIIAIV